MFTLSGDVLSGNENGGPEHIGVLQEWFGSYWWNTRIFALLFVYGFVLLPLVLRRRVGKFLSIILCSQNYGYL